MTVNSSRPEFDLADRHVLIAEDEPLLAFEIMDELERMGVISVGPIPSVGEALHKISSGEPIDAALINVQLRGELCFELADALIDRAIPFLFVTGDDAFVRQHYPDVPCHPKPSDIGAIVRALKLLVAQRKPA